MQYSDGIELITYCTGFGKKLGNSQEMCWDAVGRSGETGPWVTGPRQGMQIIQSEWVKKLGLKLLVYIQDKVLTSYRERGETGPRFISPRWGT